MYKIPSMTAVIMDHRNGKVVRVTALAITGDVEACLQCPQW